MTIREYYVSVLNAHISPELDKETECLIAKLNARNEQRKNADTKAKRETSARRLAVLNCLTPNPIFAEEIATATNLTLGQVRAALSALVRDGEADKAEVKVEKARKMAYSLHKSE